MSHCFRISGACLAVVWSVATALAEEPPPYDATDRYQIETMRGWTLRISDRFEKCDPALLDKVRRELNRQFVAIEQAVPAKAVDQLREIEIWVEVDNPLFPCMCYHAHERWLRAHGVNPEKTGHVELANAENFLSWTRHQPWMVLHELAHGYHDRFVENGYDNPRIAKALDEAIEHGLYGQVDHVAGRTRTHYASTNPMEYFAEATEAYFGRNDFYPYERADLAQYDPDAVALLRRIWGIPSPVMAPHPPPSNAKPE